MVLKIVGVIGSQRQQSALSARQPFSLPRPPFLLVSADGCPYEDVSSSVCVWQEENEAEEEVLDGVSSIVAVALRKWGDSAMPLVEPLMQTFGDVHPSLSRPQPMSCS